MVNAQPTWQQILGVSSTADAKQVPHLFQFPSSAPPFLYIDRCICAVHQIRDGYRKASLKTHPDRNPQATPAERRKLTEDFQKVADAYYVLSDPTRRRDYDAQRSARPNMFDSTSAGASADYFANFFQSNFGASAAGGAGAAAEDEGFAESESSSASGDRKDGARPDPDQTFGDVFEEVRFASIFLLLSSGSLLTLLPFGFSFCALRFSEQSLCGRGSVLQVVSCRRLLVSFLKCRAFHVAH